MIDLLFGAIAAIGGIIILVLVVTFFVASAFRLWAARIVKVENATYGTALVATLLGTLAGAAVAFVLGLLPVVGSVLGLVGAWLIDSLVVKAIFATSYGKGLLITLLASVLAALVAAGLILLMVVLGLATCGL
ncbi:MAG: hypothetical protein ACLFVD_03030 [Dehalococcoidia bacterium]